MAEYEQWDGQEERRKSVRRSSDREVCAFHDIKCKEIQSNKNTIHEIEGKMVTKEDFNKLSDKVDTRVPGWVLTLLVLITAGMIGWTILQMETKFDSLYVIKANQEVLLKAFDIKPVKTKKEAVNELNGN
jgi:hypothetical protein